jgi:superfamily II DNA or RNA helicase
MSKKLVKIGYNPVTAKLFGADDVLMTLVSNKLTYLVDGYEHTTAFKEHRWDGRSTFFTWLNATFPAGFVPMIEQELRRVGCEVQRVAHPLPTPRGPPNPVVDAFGESARYDYQPATVEQLLKRGMMIARVATGGGKSRIAKLATARLQLPTLFLTTRTVLLHQMRKGFEDAGWSVGVVGDGEWTPDPMLNVAMVQTLQMRLAEPDVFDTSPEASRQRRVRERTLKFLSTIQFVIGEEAHEAGGNGYFEVMRAMRSAQYRLALTATPFMRGDSEADMRLMATFGPIGMEISEQFLIERGILARPIFKIASTPNPPKLRRTTPYQRAIDLGIVENPCRNDEIVREVKRAASYGLTSMVLVQRKTHGKVLAELMKTAGLRAEYIFGESDQEKRDKALARLKDRKIDCLIGSTILDVGVDVPAVGLVVLAGGGKAEVAHRQRIGRGLREKKDGPNACLILDFRDEANRHLHAHAIERQTIIRSTPGFVENILPPGADFDYEALGFKKLPVA